MRTAFILFSFCFRLSLPCSIRFQFRQWSNDNSTAQCLNNQLHSNQHCCEYRHRGSGRHHQLSAPAETNFLPVVDYRPACFFPSTSCYFPDRCDTLRCLNDLLSRSHVALLTTLPKSWSLCSRRGPLSNSSRYSKLFCSICGSETQPMAAKSCCACVLTKSFRALSTKARSNGRSQESRRSTKALLSEWFC